MKKYVFFFHYNKPLSKKAGKPIITLHFKNKCYMVENIVCNASTYGHLNKSQPFFVIKGKSSKISITNRIAYIYD